MKNDLIALVYQAMAAVLVPATYSAGTRIIRQVRKAPNSKGAENIDQLQFLAAMHGLTCNF